MADKTLPPGPEPSADHGKSEWLKLLRHIGEETENGLDRLKHNFNRRFRPDELLQIVPYRGYSNDQYAYFMGRVVEYQQPPDEDKDTLWNTVVTSYQRFETDEVPGISVRATWGDHSFDATTDSEGYYWFQTPMEHVEALITYNVTISLPNDQHRSNSVLSEIVRPGANAGFGVISDIDDTILLTKATSLLQMMRLTLLQSSKARIAFKGVAAFYKALHAEKNPFFYVSSSPWNLYEFLDDFIKLKGIVGGPILLRDFGIDRDKFIAGSHKEHKFLQITKVLKCYPDLKFILIGDSGQQDPEIYAQCVADFPDRILAIYIRNHSEDDDQSALNQRIELLKVDNVPMLLVSHTLDAARHAADMGFIQQESLQAIHNDKNLDELVAETLADQDASNITAPFPKGTS